MLHKPDVLLPGLTHRVQQSADEVANATLSD